MTPENRRLNVREEWSLSTEEWAAAEHLFKAKLHRPAVTRYYYALFHAVRALLLTEGVEPRTHLSVQSEFYRRFVQEGPLSAATARTLSYLQKDREDADYSRAVVFSEEAVEHARELASVLRQEIMALLSDWLE